MNYAMLSVSGAVLGAEIWYNGHVGMRQQMGVAMESRNSLRASVLRITTLVLLVAGVGLGSRGAASREDGSVQARARVIGAGEAVAAAGLVDRMVQLITNDTDTVSEPILGLDSEGYLRVTLLDASAAQAARTGRESPCALVLVEFIAN